MVELVDLPCVRSSDPAVLAEGAAWVCRDDDCDDDQLDLGRHPHRGSLARRCRIGPAGGRPSQVGRYGRSVAEVADELGCAWHTVNDAVVAYGEALIDDDPGRIGTVSALGAGRDAVLPDAARSAASSGPPRSSMWPPAGCSTWSRAAPRWAVRLAGPPRTGLAGQHRLGHPGPLRARIGPCSTPCCPTPPRSLIRYAEFRVTGHMRRRELWRRRGSAPGTEAFVAVVVPHNSCVRGW